MSIKRKLTMTMMGLSIAAVALTALTITAYLVYDMRQSGMNELAVTAAIAADRNSAAIAFMDAERAQKNLDVFRENASILSACIYDAHGNVFASYHTGGALRPGCPAHPHIALNTAGMFTAYKEIHQNGEFAGGVFLASDTRELDAYLRKSLLISGTAAALVLALTSALAIHFQRAISAPILELAGTAQAITEKRDYAIVAKDTYHDETAVLARAFNDMLAEVRKRDGELVQANETLEQKVAQRTRELEEAKQRAEMASEAKSEFLRNMSHEFRTPLHALVSFSAYGIKEHAAAPSEQLRHYFEVIQSSAGRLSRLVGEVLDLARLEHGEQMLSLARADMHDLAQRAAELVSPLMQDKGIALKVDCEPGQTLAVCDQDKMLQVITNLLGNALKFTPPGRSIALQIRTREAQVEVSVIDEGIGIPDTEKEAIFESFRQSSRTNSGAGGTGLGLAICRHIVTAHHGRIWAENNRNGPGARVTFTLPATLEEGNRVVPMHAVKAS